LIAISREGGRWRAYYRYLFRTLNAMLRDNVAWQPKSA